MPSGSDWRGSGSGKGSPSAPVTIGTSITNEAEARAADDEVDRLNKEIVKLNRQIGEENDSAERDLLRAQKDALVKRRKKLQDMISDYEFETIGLPF